MHAFKIVAQFTEPLQTMQNSVQLPSRTATIVYLAETLQMKISGRLMVQMFHWVHRSRTFDGACFDRNGGQCVRLAHNKI